MKNKKDLMKRLSIAGGAFGYFCMTRFPIGFKFLFLVMALLALIIYIIESIKNNYSRISIVVSVLSILMIIILLMDEIIIYKYPQFLGYRGYIMAVGTIIIMGIIICGDINYNKIANKRERLFSKALSLIIFGGVVLLIILVVLKKSGVIPQ